jgi:hypothetical protein
MGRIGDPDRARMPGTIRIYQTRLAFFAYIR